MTSFTFNGTDVSIVVNPYVAPDRLIHPYHHSPAAPMGGAGCCHARPAGEQTSPTRTGLRSAPGLCSQRPAAFWPGVSERTLKINVK